MRMQSPIVRRKSRQIMVGKVPVGGDAPIAVQSMTNTDTCDVAATLDQIRRLEAVGADIVRVSVPTMDAAEAFRKIRAGTTVPLVADIHFDYRIAMKVLEYGVDCLRINPGNIGRDERMRTITESARDKGVPIRIGVNAGSLGKELMRKYGEPNADAMVESALHHIDILDSYNFQDFKVSLKASEVFMTVAAYRKLATQIVTPASRYHRSRWFAFRHSEKFGRSRSAVDGRHRRHHSYFAGGRSGGRDQGWFRYSQEPGSAPQRRESCRLPELLASELRRDCHRQCA